MSLLLAMYVRGHRHHPADKYVPAASWLRAGIYFCFCYLMAWFSGALSAALAQPIATSEQLVNPVWQAWALGLFVLVSVGYWIIWARFTIRFERKLELIPQIIFGLLWGLASGFLFLSFWHFVQMAVPDLPTWAVWLISYLIISIWQWLWQDYGWDVYISPEHDCPWSIMVKVPATHVPNVTSCLIFFALYENYWIFVGLQTWALLGASIAMRMPSPWSREETPAARQAPGMFGIPWPRAGGYEVTDARQDIYVRSTRLPAGTTIWLLASHVLVTLGPLLTLALAQLNLEYLQTIMAVPQLLSVGALLLMAAGVYEIAHNKFEHYKYSVSARSGIFEAGYGSLTCLAMATMMAACYGLHAGAVIASYGLALAYYPASYLMKWGRGVVRAVLAASLVVALYYRLADSLLWLALLAIFFTIYFYQLLHRTRAQSFQGFLVASSAFGLCAIPLAIHNSARDISSSASSVMVFGAVLVGLALMLWPRLSRVAPTSNAHGPPTAR